MNKKIKMIELLNRIVNQEKLPERIKWGTVNYILRQDSLDGHLYYEKEQGCTSLVAELKTMDDLKSEVEILEENTEEIEEIELIGTNFMDMDKNQLKDEINKNRILINKLRQEIFELRKDKNND